MKLIASKFLRTSAKKTIRKLHKLDKIIDKHPKKALAIAGSTFIAANLGLAAYGHKKYKQSKNKKVQGDRKVIMPKVGKKKFAYTKAGKKKAKAYAKKRGKKVKY